MAGAGEYGGVWKVVSWSNNKAFSEAAKGLNFSCGPPIGVGRLTLKMSFPFLPEEVLPFDVKVGGKLPGVKPAIHLGDGVVQKVTFLRPYSILASESSKPGKRSEANPMMWLESGWR